jgi:WD40 repeat protein
MDEHVMASVGTDGKLIVWGLQAPADTASTDTPLSYRTIATFNFDASANNARVRWHTQLPNQLVLLTGESAKLIKIKEADTLVVEAELKLEDSVSPLTDACWSPDGNWLLSSK